MKKILLMALLFVAIKLNAQITFRHDYGSSFGTGRYVQQTNDGGYIMAGLSPDTAVGGTLLIKVDSLGNLQWSKRFKIPNYSWSDPTCVQQTNDNGYIICGNFKYNVDTAFLIKTDIDGNMTWAKTYGKAYYNNFMSVRQNSLGYLIGGSYAYLDSTAAYSCITQVNANGNVVWSKTYGDTIIFNYQLQEIEQTIDGNYIAVSNANSDSLGGKNAEIDHLISLESDHPFSHQIDHPFLLQTDHPLAGR